MSNTQAYCPHCHRPLFSGAATKCTYCKNPIKWPKKKPIKAKMVVILEQK